MLMFIFGSNIPKIVLSVFVLFIFLFYTAKNFSDLDFFFFFPIIVVPIYVFVWPEVGYINLIYTILFGWILARDYTFTIKILKITFFVQLFLVLHELYFSKYIFELVSIGVVKASTAQVIVEDYNFSETGFRPKGLFSGTLVATSFIIYMAMIFRNDFKMLFGIFIMALIVNGRLALLISFVTFLLKFLLKYEVVMYQKKLSFSLKILLLLVVGTGLISLVLFSLPDVVISNLLNTFNLTSDANLGRIISYLQSMDLFFSYSMTEMVFGSPDNFVTDQFGRETASESGVLSMVLDIGLFGLFIYLLTLFELWRIPSANKYFVNKSHVGIKYVIVMTLLAFLQYEHVNGNLRGGLFWFVAIVFFNESKRSRPVKYDSSLN